MQRMKFLKSILICLFIAVMFLAGCSSADEIESTADSSIRIITATPRDTAMPTTTPTPQVPVLEEDALQGLQIEFWYPWDPTIPDTIEVLVNQFNRQNESGIEVVSRVFSHPADFETAVQESIATRQTPDVVLAAPYQYNAWRSAGGLVDLAPYLESSSYGLTLDELDQFYPAILNRDLYGEERIAFPGLFSARVMLYNQTWADDLGFRTPPTSSAGFIQQACAAHESNGDRTGGWMIDTSPGSAAAWLLAFTPGLESGSRYAFDADGVEAAFTFLSDLRVAGCAWQPTSAYPDQAFVDRLGLFYPVSTREIRFVQQAFDQSAGTDQWTAIAYPNDLGESWVSLYGSSYLVLEASIEEQIASWLFIRAMVSDQNQIQLAETNLYLPLNREVSARLQAEDTLPEPWLESLDLLERGVAEPRFASWRVVRGVVQDAVAEVMDERFVPGTMSLFLKQLRELAAELHQSVP